ncbi:shikimate dehydrogenase [Marinobacterium sp. AK62]|uniref:Shikimate dehydrogenase (NADP(+)) n=1 Tax=Marinobacterium alkalitolerans TaxID=1542925 RepID=A0ABS3ZFY3_9GAMM|nr:shikimate dehydrogenase [Marinobacterium alkalitolerans]MBP0049949.1 shikimate dehydrogenase [Marinobacterium alkalitolerans]
MSDRYAVLGNPVAHSKSPQIHTAFARQTGEDLSYTAEHVESPDFEAAVGRFLQGNGKGVNITVPFKERAWALAQWRSERAEKAGAANTLYRLEDGRLAADNTDGVGLVRDLADNNGVTLQGARVLVLGAGGAVRGVLQPLLKAGVQSILVANRTLSRAEALAELFAADGTLAACGFDAIPAEPFDLIINGTSASLQGELPPVPAAAVVAQTACYDMMYGAEPTPFCRWAREQGATQVMDGLGMLVEQAAEAFQVWRGVKPETARVIADLRRAMTA